MSEPISFDSILNSDSKDNVIYYVTTDHRPLEVDESDFNAPIFKHEYHKDNGYGEIVFMVDVTIIGDSAFRECETLEKIIIPETVTEIGEDVFFGCSSLTSLTIPYGVTEIGIGAFGGCSSLTNIHLPDSVTNIGEIAFAWCESLTTVTIPYSVTEIGQQAFDGCSSLASVYCTPITPPSGSRWMFDDNDIGRKIYVPGERVAQYKSATYWKDYAEDIVAYDFENGEIFGSVISYTTTDGNIVTPSQYCDFGARIISNTYKDGKGMITFDNSVTLIGEGAFSKCSNLTSITIPESVTIIEECSFEDCSNLKVFSGKFASKDGRCLVYNGRLIAFAPSEISTYTIPNNVTSIGVSAFWSCTSLISITIPDSVTSIGYNAFNYCI